MTHFLTRILHSKIDLSRSKAVGRKRVSFLTPRGLSNMNTETNKTGKLGAGDRIQLLIGRLHVRPATMHDAGNDSLPKHLHGQELNGSEGP